MDDGKVNLEKEYTIKNFVDTLMKPVGIKKCK